MINFPKFTVNEYVTGEKFKNLCDVTCEKPEQELNENYERDILDYNGDVCILFCQTHNLKKVIPFVETVDKKFIIVSHNSDGTIGYKNSDRWFDYQWKPIKNILWWYCQNVEVDEPNVTPIPIAIENEYIFLPEIKQFLMFDLSLQNIKKEDKLFLCFNLDTNKLVRRSAKEFFQDQSWCTWKDGYNNINNVSSYFTEMLKHKFVLAPDGNGFDTIRIWEALYIGCVPVVSRHKFTEYFASKLPIIVVDTFNNVTLDFLLEKYDELKNRNFDFNELKMSWWKNEIWNRKKLVS